MIRVHESFKHTQIERAKDLLLKFVKEDEFWGYFTVMVAKTDLSQHDLLENDAEIIAHLRLMFNSDLNIEIVPYKTKYPFSSVIGHAEGNRVFENVRKIDALTVPERTGHLGHEIVHLFGYRHDYQGQKTSVAVVFGGLMQEYADMRMKELKLKP